MVFINRILYLDRRSAYSGHTPNLHQGEKPLIQIHHDEPTFYANVDQVRYWSDGTLNVLKQKSPGQAIMVSDFNTVRITYSLIMKNQTFYLKKY